MFDTLAARNLLVIAQPKRKLLLVSLDPYYKRLCAYYAVTVLTKVKAQPNTTYGDICSPPFPAASFDVIVQVHVLEHIKDDRKATTAIYNLLRPGGNYISNIPCKKGKPTVEFSAADPKNHGHWRLYGTDDYAALLRDCRFVSVERVGATFTARR